MKKKDVELGLALILIKAMQDKENCLDEETVRNIKNKYNFEVGKR